MATQTYPHTHHRKLGRKAIVHDSRTLKLVDYLTAQLPAPPMATDWTHGVTDWGMMCNDQLGCCTIAGAAHAIQVWTANSGTMLTEPDSVVVNYYEQWDGYVPSEPSTDQGGIELNVLKQWKQNGLNGNQLLAFADANAMNLDEIRQAITLFGGVYIGLALPLSAQNQSVWDVDPTAGDQTAAGSWGGHCVFVPQYDQDGFTCVTWGALQRMTTRFWLSYCDEAHVLLDAGWMAGRQAPNGFNLDQLMADLGQIR